MTEQSKPPYPYARPASHAGPYAEVKEVPVVGPRRPQGNSVRDIARTVGEDVASGSPTRPLIKGAGLDRPFFADKERAFWLLQSLGWTGFALLRFLTGVANGLEPLKFLFHVLVLTATGYSLTLLLGAVYKRLITMRAGVTAVVSLALVGLSAAVFSIVESWSYSTFVNFAYQPRGLQFFGGLVLDFALLAAWSALYYGINYYLLLEEQMDQRRELESQASAAQLAMLRYQLNPHFLFNTLNSISTLVLLSERERANAMLSRLSSFLRYTLANEPTSLVPLAKEVETLKLYLGIEKMRFEERMRTHFRLGADTVNALLPSLLLQPVIENAIKYAVTPSENGADIFVTSKRDGNAVRIEVADSGAGDAMPVESHSTGVGLANIRSRLEQAYGNQHGFETKTNERGGFSVVITIPYETKASDT